jgi:hypothetical protein
MKWQSPLKTNPAAPHQGRRHAAHRSGGQSLYAQIVKGSRAPRLRMDISNRSAVAQRQYRRVYLTVSLGHVRFTPESGRRLALRGMSALCHVWTAPSWQGFSSRLQAGRCSHVFGLLARHTGRWP